MGIEDIRKIKKLAGQPKEKKIYRIREISLKKQARKAEEKKNLNGEDTLLEKWFQARRKQMTGTCQCGCLLQSSKKDDKWFRSSAAHILPQADFPSVMYHPLNYVERNFWDGCHTNMDQQGIDRWPGFADWNEIKEKFYILAPLLTDEERASKFYTKLESVVYAKSKRH